jgi:hypothetical protein
MSNPNLKVSDAQVKEDGSTQLVVAVAPNNTQ